MELAEYGAQQDSLAACGRSGNEQRRRRRGAGQQRLQQQALIVTANELNRGFHEKIRSQEFMKNEVCLHFWKHYIQFTGYTANRPYC